MPDSENIQTVTAPDSTQPPPPDNTQPSNLDKLSTLPQWFIAFVGLAYATGFIAVYAFDNNFGLKGISLDFFKIKYLYVGMIFILFPIAIAIPFITLFYLRHFHGWSLDKFWMRVPPTFIFVNMIFSIYVFILFTPRGFILQKTIFLSRFFWIVAISILPLCFLIYIAKIENTRLSIWVRFFLRCLLLVIMILFDIPLFWEFGSDIWNIVIIDGGYYFIIIMLFIGILAYRILTIKDRNYGDIATKHISVLLICTLASSYFFAAYSFGLRIYPYIPAYKGGGDYSNTSSVIIHFKDIKADHLPSEIRPKEKIGSNKLIVIEESTNSIFLVNPNDAGGPIEWRKMGSAKPCIYEIRKENLTSIIYLNSANYGIVLLHGKANMPTQLLDLIGALEAHGFLVCAPEMPWSRNRYLAANYETALQEISDAIVKLKEQGSQKIIVAGYDMGANAALAYAVTRSDINGVIMLAPGHDLDSPWAKEKFKKSIDRARNMVKSGRGTQYSDFFDIKMGMPSSLTTQAQIYLSYFDPEGLGAVGLNANRLNPKIPLLLAIGDKDPLYKPSASNDPKKIIFEKAPVNPFSRYNVVSAEHMYPISSQG